MLLLLVASVFIWAGFYFWEKRATIAIYTGAVLALAVMYGVPFYIYGRITTAYPQFNALLKGEAPWNAASRTPIRLLVMSGFAIGVASIGIGTLFGSIWLIEYASKLAAS